MNKDVNIFFSCNLKYILLILIFYFISFTEGFITTNRHGINLNNSFYQTKSRYHFNSKQNKLLCFLSNNTGCLNNFSKTTNAFVPNIPFNIKDDLIRQNFTSEHEIQYPVRVFTYERFPYVFFDNFKYVYATICSNELNIEEIIKTEIKKLRCDGISNMWRYDVLDANIVTLTQNDAYKYLQPGIAVSYNSTISKGLEKKLSEKNIRVIRGENINDIVEMAKEQLTRIAGEYSRPTLYGKAEVNKLFKRYKGEISSLKRETDYPIDIFEGESCVITLEGFEDFKVGDVVESYIN
uniref:Uncharacterized protein n=1 Tax=Theileria parva TaxID=5875 RepID=Q4N2R7_THEPA|eukprot:XP_763914.1 hypothetical protein [Theileria parva strain Muguga]